MTYIINFEYLARITTALIVTLTLGGCFISESENITIDKKLESARNAMLDKDDFKAVNLLKEILQKDPESYQARLLISRIYQKNGESEKAIANIKKAAKNTPQSSLVLLDTGRILLSLGEYSALLEQIEVDDGLDERSNSNIIGLRSQALLLLDKIEESKKEISRSNRLSDRGVDDSLARIKIEIASANYALASQYLETAISNFPGENRFEWLLAKIEVNNGDNEKGVNRFRALMDRQNPNYSPMLARRSGYELIKAEVAEGKLKEAEKVVLDLLARNRGDVRALYLGGLVALIGGNYHLAERRFLKLEKGYSIESVRLLLGVVYMATKSYERSRFYLANFYKKNRSNLWAAKLLIRSYVLLGEPYEAKQVFGTLDGEGLDASEDAELLILRTMLFRSDSNRATISEQLQRASLLVKDSPIVRKLLSKAFLDNEQLDESLVHSNYVFKNQKLDAGALELAVLAMAKKNKHHTASELINIFTSAGGDPVVAGNLEGMLQLLSGNYSKAITVFQSLPDTHPNHWETKLGLAKAHELSGDFNSANKIFDSLVLESRARDEALNGLLRTAYLHGSIEDLNNAVEVSRGYNYKSVDPLIYLGAKYIQLEDFENSKKLVETIRLLSPGHPGEQLLLAIEERKKGNFAAAEKITRAALTSNPDYRPMLFLMVGLQKNNGDTAEAEKYLRRLDRSTSLKPALQLKKSKFSEVEWARAVSPVMKFTSFKSLSADKTVISLMKLGEEEIQNTTTHSELKFSDPSSKQNYSHGRSGDLARINRTLFFNYYGGFVEGRMNEQQLARKAKDGLLYDKGSWEVYDELNDMLGQRKVFGRGSSYKDFERHLRLPSWLAFIGMIVVVIVIISRSRAHKRRRKVLAD